MATTITSGVQYSGIWSLSGQANAKALGTWPTQPLPTFGGLYSWGLNSSGQLGLGDTANRSSPNQVGALTTWLNVSAGSSSSFAVKTDGTMWSWGNGSQGGLGLGNLTSYSSPKQVGALTAWLSVTGRYAVLATKTDGTLWSWGSNGSGQLGLGNTVDRSSPVQVGALTTWQYVSTSSGGHTVANKTDGTLWAWGRNQAGQLGLNNTTYYSSPKQVGALTSWTTLCRSMSGANSTSAIAVV